MMKAYIFLPAKITQKTEIPLSINMMPNIKLILSSISLNYKIFDDIQMILIRYNLYVFF